MSDASQKSPEELVLLGQAGYAKEEIQWQVEHLCASPPFEKQDLARQMLVYLVEEALAGRVPNAANVATKLGKRDFGSGDSYVRAPKLRLLDGLEEHYARHARPDEIRLVIRKGSYIVFAPRKTVSAPGYAGRPSVSILQPSEREEVYRCVPVRGRIDMLDPDLRLWLVVLVTGSYFPQCRVSRRSPSWEYEVRVGVVTWGAIDGQEFTIQLIAVDIEGDCILWNHLKTNGHAIPISFLPTDMHLLDTRRVVRRDIRPAKAVP